ncbi:MAG: MFS transporter [Candidatus Saccharibacteria bacterium]|nr:MFS transporter [Candidatus Saccharibacteria bacterium]
MRKNDPLRNLRLVILESAVTAGILAVPIMTPFYLSIGLNQEQIAMSQMAFTAVAMLLNLPLGWVADRFSRKWANVIGDSLVALALLLYSTAQSFWFVVLCETFCGVSCALSQGVDSTLLKHFAEKIDDSGKLFKDKYAKMASYRQIATLIVMLLGGPIGAINFRLAIAISSLTHFTGALVSLLIVDDSEKLTATRGPFSEMVALVSRNLSNHKLRTRIIAFAVAREVTHGIIWVFTPLMLYVGVPLAVVSMGWVTNYIAAYLGTRFARRFAPKMQDWQLFIVPIALVSIASLTMLIDLNIVTVCLYALFGMAQGWSAATMIPLIKEHVRAAEQSSVESFARVVAQLLYIGAVWAINRAADIELRYALLATIIIFVPLAIPIAIKLRKD